MIQKTSKAGLAIIACGSLLLLGLFILAMVQSFPRPQQVGRRVYETSSATTTYRIIPEGVIEPPWQDRMRFWLILFLAGIVVGVAIFLAVVWGKYIWLEKEIPRGVELQFTATMTFATGVVSGLVATIPSGEGQFVPYEGKPTPVMQSETPGIPQNFLGKTPTNSKTFVPSLTPMEPPAGYAEKSD